MAELLAHGYEIKLTKQNRELSISDAADVWLCRSLWEIQSSINCTGAFGYPNGKNKM